VWLEIEQKKVRNCRQYKEGRGQQGVMGEREGGGIQNLKAQ